MCNDFGWDTFWCQNGHKQKITAGARKKKTFKNFFVEKHNNKLPIWKIKIPSQIPSQKGSASIKLKHFFAKITKTRKN